MGALISSWLNTVKVIELQESLLDTWMFFRLFLTTLTADDKISHISKDKWKETIRMNFSQKPKIFSKNFSAFFEPALNFEHFQKKDDPDRICISEITDHERRAWINIKKTPVWEDVTTGDMEKGPKNWFNVNESVFFILSDHCEGNWLAKVTLRHMKILQTFSYLIDC